MSFTKRGLVGMKLLVHLNKINPSGFQNVQERMNGYEPVIALFVTKFHPNDSKMQIVLQPDLENKQLYDSVVVLKGLKACFAEAQMSYDEQLLLQVADACVESWKEWKEKYTPKKYHL